MEASRIRGGRLCSTTPTGSGGSLACGKTTLNFRQLVAKHKPGQGLLEKTNAHPKSQGLKLREGIIVGAASSTENRSGEPDPEMRQAKRATTGTWG